MPPMPKYRRIATVIEEYLARTRPARGEKFFTDRALAEYFSTTVVTVAHSLNYLCQKGLLVRRAGSGTYIGGDAAKHVKSRIGVVCHEMIIEEGFYVSPVLSRFGKFFTERNYDVISFCASSGEYRHLMEEYELSGIMVFCPRPEFAGEIAELRGEGVPVVSIGYAMPEINGISFGSDHMEVIQMAVDYLYNLGHRRIALLHHRKHSCCELFSRAYSRAMWTRRLPANPDWNMIPDDDTADPLEELYRRGEMPTALIVGSPRQVIYVYNFCQRRNIRIPDDLSVLAMGDAEMFQQLDPPLSAIMQNLPEIADRAANTLLDMIRLNPIPETLKSAVAPIFTERESCRAIPVGSADGGIIQNRKGAISK